MGVLTSPKSLKSLTVSDILNLHHLRIESGGSPDELKEVCRINAVVPLQYHFQKQTRLLAVLYTKANFHAKTQHHGPLHHKAKENIHLSYKSI